jgi:hypothetical protein
VSRIPPVTIRSNCLPAKRWNSLSSERDDRLVAARITLASRPPEQLAIDAAGLVILGQDDVQASCLSHRGMKLDVGEGTFWLKDLVGSQFVSESPRLAAKSRLNIPLLNNGRKVASLFRSP